MKTSSTSALKPVFILGILTLWLGSRVEGALTASAGPDITVAPNVPVVLTAGSNAPVGSSVRYLWKQTGGITLDLIGADRRTAMVLSANQPGTYTVNLRVTSGAESASDDVQITIAAPPRRVIYVDGSLPANIVNGTYSVINRDGSGSNGNAYKTPQEAADVVRPGDTVQVRGGTYRNTFISNQVYLEVLHITTSGTATAPIRFETYPGESVILEGFGFEDRDLTGDGRADGPLYSSKRETLILVEGDYIQIAGFKLQRSQGNALLVRKNFCYIEECFALDNWAHGFLFEANSAAGAKASVIRWCETARSRHGGGGAFVMNQDAPGILTHGVLAECLFHDNGFQPDGTKVLPSLGDSTGGGNSDGMGASKFFSDSVTFDSSALVNNYGPENFLIRNVCWKNSDDGFDSSLADSLIEDNICIENGPQGKKGFKMLRAVRGMVFRGNVAMGNVAAGFEVRVPDGELLTLQHNTALGNGAQGILGGNTTTSYRSNLCAFNVMNDFVPAATTPSDNWSEDNTNVAAGFSGNPGLVNPSFVLNGTTFGSLTIKARHAAISAQVSAALRPKPGSPLIDRGILVAGYHCERADDDPISPMPPTASGRHWFGTAPDIGAFESLPGAPPPPLPLAAPVGLRVR